MELEFITVGPIVNTHGIRGEVKLLPQGIEADLLRGCKTLYINDKPCAVEFSRVHKGCLLVKLEGVDDMDTALTYKNKTVTIRRKDIKLPKGVYFDQELVGMTARDAETGEELGTVEEVLDYPAHKVYVVRGGRDEFMIPAVPAFIKSIDIAAEVMEIHVWEGMGSHEN